MTDDELREHQRVSDILKQRIRDGQDIESHILTTDETPEDALPRYDHFRHALASTTTTRCGLNPEATHGHSLMIACDCGHPNCEFPTNCPGCLGHKSHWN